MTAAPSQPDLFAAAPAPDLPEGFAFRPDVIPTAQERACAGQFTNLPLAPFEFHGFLGKRRVLSFGWRYDYAQRRLNPSHEMPPFLMELREVAASVAGLPSDRLQQVLVTEYSPGSAIGWAPRQADVRGRRGAVIPLARPAALPPPPRRALGAPRARDPAPFCLPAARPGATGVAT